MKRIRSAIKRRKKSPMRRLAIAHLENQKHCQLTNFDQVKQHRKISHKHSLFGIFSWLCQAQFPIAIYQIYRQTHSLYQGTYHKRHFNIKLRNEIVLTLFLHLLVSVCMSVSCKQHFLCNRSPHFQFTTDAAAVFFFFSRSGFFYVHILSLYFVHA